MTDKTLDLFPEDRPKRQTRADAPLAERMRPQTWEDFQGLSGLDQRLIEQLRSGRGRPPSLILWGPPGSGKTTLARLVGKCFDAVFVEVSAVLVGVKEIREIANTAKKEVKATILFVDEIHRLTKAQQDAFLPHVEAGTFILIGATTENPSFYLTNAIRSRARVVVLPELGVPALFEILTRAAQALGVSVGAEVESLLSQLCGGDARQLLNTLEALVQTGAVVSGGTLSREVLENFLSTDGKRFYDRGGEEHYNIASAFIKSLRGSDPDAALYWGFRMIDSGEDPRFVIRRMIIFASEDIGNADPRALTIAVSTSEAFERIGMPEGSIPIAQCICYLACAPKSNRSYQAMKQVRAVIERSPKTSVPAHLRNAPTALMRELGYGEGYQYPHDAAQGTVYGEQYLPDEIADQTFYNPSERGVEQHFIAPLEALRKSQNKVQRRS